MSSIFTKIIEGEIPSYRVYEDESVYAFLDINPMQPGHTLVVPRAEVPVLFELPADDYTALWNSARTVAGAIEEATGCERVAVVVWGYDVPHAHIHLIPTDRTTPLVFGKPVDQTPEQMAAMAARIAAATVPFDETTALVVVDVQNDFADPDGSLSVPGAGAIIGAINAQIARATRAGATVVYTQDWHPAETPHFADFGGVWPVHCIGGTWGSEFHPDLEVIDDAVFTRKGTGGENGYSGFSMEEVGSEEAQSTGLHEALQERGIERVVLAGLATDYCVKFSGLDAIRLGYDAVVLTGCIRAVDLEKGDGDRALDELRDAGVKVV